MSCQVLAQDTLAKKKKRHHGCYIIWFTFMFIRANSTSTTSPSPLAVAIWLCHLLAELDTLSMCYPTSLNFCFLIYTKRK